MTSVAVESSSASVDHWQVVWQWSPWLVAGLAVVAVIVGAASMRHRRGLPGIRLIAIAARIMAIGSLVVMLSGWTVAPHVIPEAAMEPFVPSLTVRAPRIVRLGDAACIDVEARLPPRDSDEHTADLVGANGSMVASASLFRKFSVAGDGRPDSSRRGERVRGRIVWRPESAGTFSGSVRVRGEAAIPSAEVSLTVADEPLRVMLLDRPRFESRFLSRLLSRDGRFEVTERLQGPGSPFPGSGGVGNAAAGLPETREAWNRFDAVVIGAIDPLAVPETAAAALVAAAAQDGVGIVWTLDAVSDPEAIAVSPLGRLLPFRGVSRQPPFTAAFGIELADAGEDAAWLAVADDAAVSGEAWRTMPSVYAASVPSAIRPTARVMATCQTTAKAGGGLGPKSPFILVDQAGESRIVAFLAETWRLRQGARGPFVDRLLSQAMLHAAEPHFASRLLGDTSIAPAQGPHDGMPARGVPDTPVAGRPLWNHPAILLALIAACGIEWWSRNRLGDGP